jgi:ankyrin repeat protein
MDTEKVLLPSEPLTAVMNNHIEEINRLIENNDPEVETKGADSLIFAIQKNYSHMVMLLLSSPKININKRNAFSYTALIAAVEKGDAHLVKLLLDVSGILVNEHLYGDTPLILAVKKNHMEVVNILLSDPRTLYSGG